LSCSLFHPDAHQQTWSSYRGGVDLAMKSRSSTKATAATCRRSLRKSEVKFLPTFAGPCFCCSTLIKVKCCSDRSVLL
jgi:hypothetical protein